VPGEKVYRRHRLQEYVRWSDVDISGIICFAAYARIIETAEMELFRAIGFPYATVWDELDIWLPRVQLHYDFRSPALLDELLDVEVWVGRMGKSSLQLEFGVQRPNGEVAAEAHLVAVTVDRDRQRPVPIPDRLRAALAPYRADREG
jgi:acyl-CoA thioester hydrolase